MGEVWTISWCTNNEGHMNTLRSIIVWVYEVGLGILACSVVLEYVYPGSVSSYFNAASLVATCVMLFAVLSVLGGAHASHKDAPARASGVARFLAASMFSGGVCLLIGLSLGFKFDAWSMAVIALVAVLVFNVYMFLDS